MFKWFGKAPPSPIPPFPVSISILFLYFLSPLLQLLCYTSKKSANFKSSVTEPNSQFIELNPEAALSMAWTLQIADVTRAALRILVSECAIEVLGSETHTPMKRHTIFGRPRGDLPDEIQNMLEHATQSLVERVRDTSAQLYSPQILDLFELRDWRTLQYMGARSSPELQDLFAGVATRLHAYLEDALDWALRVDHANSRYGGYDRDRQCYVPRQQLIATAAIEHHLTLAQRLLMPEFWNRLTHHVSNCMFFIVFRSGDMTTLREALDAFQSAFVEYSRNHHGSSNEEDKDTRYPFVKLTDLHIQLSTAVRALAQCWTNVHDHLEIPFVRTRHLNLCLAEPELRYLPVWAGGADDGYGAVFQERPVPDCDYGEEGEENHLGLGALEPDPRNGAHHHQQQHRDDRLSNHSRSVSTLVATTRGLSIAVAPTGQSGTGTATDGRSVLHPGSGSDSSSSPPIFTPSEGTLEDVEDFDEYVDPETVDIYQEDDDSSSDDAVTWSTAGDQD